LDRIAEALMKADWAKSRTSISSSMRNGERVENNCLSASTVRAEGAGNDGAKRWENFRPPATLCTEFTGPSLQREGGF